MDLMVAQIVGSSAHGHYDSVAREYNLPRHEAFYREIARTLIGGLPAAFSPASILDVGGGTGFSASELTRRFPAARITIVEPSAAMAALASERCGPALTVLPQLPGEHATYDLVFSSMSFHWLTAQQRTMMASLVSCKGALAIAAPGRMASPRAEGNEILLGAFRRLKVEQPAMALPPTARGFVSSDLNAIYLDFNEQHCFNQEILDSGPPSKFAETLEVRGSLKALFSDQNLISRARQIIETAACLRLNSSRSLADVPLEMRWPVLYWTSNRRP